MCSVRLSKYQLSCLQMFALPATTTCSNPPCEQSKPSATSGMGAMTAPSCAAGGRPPVQQISPWRKTSTEQPRFDPMPRTSDVFYQESQRLDTAETWIVNMRNPEDLEAGVNCATCVNQSQDNFEL